MEIKELRNGRVFNFLSVEDDLVEVFLEDHLGVVNRFGDLNQLNLLDFPVAVVLCLIGILADVPIFLQGLLRCLLSGEPSGEVEVPSAIEEGALVSVNFASKLAVVFGGKDVLSHFAFSFVVILKYNIGAERVNSY